MNQVLEKRAADFFAAIPRLEWEVNLDEVAIATEIVLRELAADKALFRHLIGRIPTHPRLWSKCEEDVVEDKLVLWDDAAKALRIRLRMSTNPQERLAHCHRFSFTNLVLRGKYIHWQYSPLPTFDEMTRLDEVKEVVIHEERAGDCFTIHHDTLHSTPFTEAHTISLVLRGNPLKERAPVMFKESRGRAEAFALANPFEEPHSAPAGAMFWRVGEDQESKERRAERQMPLERFRFWVRQFEEYSLI